MDSGLKKEVRKEKWDTAIWELLCTYSVSALSPTLRQECSRVRLSVAKHDEEKIALRLQKAAVGICSDLYSV